MLRNAHKQSDDSMRISRSKSKNQISIVSKLKQKESGWNNRFYLDHIPEYNFNNQEHSQYLKNKFRLPIRRNQLKKIKILEQSLQKNKVTNRPTYRNQQKTKQAIIKAYSDLKSLWYQKEIPNQHMQSMTKIFNKEANPTKVLDDIKKQYYEISKEMSLVQKVMLSVVTRENCYQVIKNLCAMFENMDINTIKQQFQGKITHLRILTIHCIECIFQWQQNLQSLSPNLKKLQYLHNSHSYTKKIKQDYIQIANSPFNTIYQFDTIKLDPFFLNYVLLSTGKKLSNVSKNLVKRIRLCEGMLSDQSENRMQVKKINVGIRTPVQKMYGEERLSVGNRSKNKTEESMPIWSKVLVQYSSFPTYIVNLLSASPYKHSFQPQIQLQKYEQLTIYKYNETQEEIVFGLDKNASQRKIIIFALKSTNDGVQKFLKLFCESLWKMDGCSQVRVPLLHIKNEESYQVDLELEKKLKAIGFKWTSVNHSKDIRITIYGMKRPLNVVTKKNGLQNQSYPILIQHLIVFNTEYSNNKKLHNKCFISGLDLILKVGECNPNQFQELAQKPLFSNYFTSISKIKTFLSNQAIQDNCQPQTTFSYPGMRSFHIENQETSDKIFKNMQLTFNKIPSIISLLNVSFKYQHITIQDNKYTKFFPNKDSQILICESTFPIYLLQADEQNINFFVIEVNEGFEMSSIQNILNSMGSQSSFIDEFWLPNFHKNQEYLDQVGFPCTQVISTNYQNSLGSLTRKSKVRTKIIKAPFVFGMIHKRLLEILEIPFYCTLVGKENLV